MQKSTDSTKKILKSVSQEARVIKASTKETASVMTTAISSFEQTAEKICQTGNKLKDTSQMKATFYNTFTALPPILEETAEEVDKATQIATTRLEELDKLLGKKESELAQAQIDVQILNSTLKEQTLTITQLENAVKTLNCENEEKSKTITEMEKKLVNLNTETKRLSQNCQFFKELVEKQSSSEQDSPRLTSVPTPSVDRLRD